MKKDGLIAEFIGIMLGDGSIGIYNTHVGNKIKKHRTVKVTLDSRNEGYINHVTNMMRNVLNVEPRIHYKNSEGYKRKENAVDIKTHKKEKFDYVLNEIGLKISPKWNRMKIPEGYEKGKLSLFVLKGLFDTDGCVAIYDNNGTIYPRIEIKLSPCPAQEQINNILDEFGFHYKIQKLDRGKTSIRISGKTELKKWFGLIGSSNPIHLERAKQFL